MHKKFIYLLYFVLICLLGILFKEYFHLKCQQQKLHALQSEYQKYLTYYKQAINKYAQDQCAKGEFFFAPKKDTVSEFLVVNRAIPYLKQAALQFGKQQKIGSGIEALYEPGLQQSNKQEKKGKTKSPVTKKLQWPIDRERFWISSKFGPRKTSGNGKGFHHGIDLAALKGTLVKAALKGVVVEAEHSSFGYGNCIVIRHAQERIKTRYAHLDSILVKKGDRVKAGEIIGRVGNTGFVRGINGDHSNATHLHFEVMLAGEKRVDPLLLLT